MKSARQTTSSVAMPRQVRSQLAKEAKPLDAEVQRRYSARLGHDFSRVRLHAGPASDSLARAYGARALAAGDQVVLSEDGARKEETLAHELAHVAQQARDGNPQTRGNAEQEARRAASGETGEVSAAPEGVYFDGPEDEEEQPPVPTSLRMRPLLPQLQPPQFPSWMWDPNFPAPRPPLWTPGAGPSTPRPATGGDVASAVTGIPMVSSALSGLGDQALRDLSRAWSQSDWLGRGAMIGTGSALAAGLMLPMLMPESREQAGASFPYSAIQNTDIPLGPVGVNFSATGPERHFQLMLDLARLIPALRR